MTARFHSSIAEIGRAVWNNLNPGGHPFTSYEFLSALEDGGCLHGRTGWYPHHLALYNGPDIAALMPCYIKTNSWGEYVFDHGWADAYMQAGGTYYPKLQISVPFSPVTGPRLLGDESLWPDALAAIEAELPDKFSSAHITFLPRGKAEDCGHWLVRHGYQFHWQNQNYKTFDDFLAGLTRKKRKNIAKERREVAEKGLSFEHLSGPDITAEIISRFYQFYIDTIGKKWAAAYLTEDFFQLLIKRMADNVLLVAAFQDGDMIAGALNLMGHDRLYGRHWGCLAEHKFLHFECCYYQAIDYAIKHGLKTVEAGAQGPHKVQRGYLPVKTYSLHFIEHPGFREAVRDFLDREQTHIAHEIAYFLKKSPYT